MIRLALALLAVVSMASAADNMQAFPPAGKGMTRFVLHLPEASNEADLKVELIVGKTVKTDAVNQHFFGGDLKTVTVDGWGFDYYILRKLGPMMGTLIGLPLDSPEVERFVTLRGEPRLVRYNSRLPLVIYVPEGVEVRYRLWRADPNPTAVDKG